MTLLQVILIFAAGVVGVGILAILFWLGYSAYLHPVGDGLLLGVGQDATEQGLRSGAQVSLFDVSDPASPRRLQQRAFGSATSSERYRLSWPLHPCSNRRCRAQARRSLAPSEWLPLVQIRREVGLLTRVEDC